MGKPAAVQLTRRLFEMLTILRVSGKVSPEEFVFGPHRYDKTFYAARDAAGLGRDAVWRGERSLYVGDGR